MFSSPDEVYDVSISWNYITLSVTYFFGQGKWAKIERNGGKLLCVKTSLVDWSVSAWAQWVSKTIPRIVWASLISSLEVSRYDWLPHRFSLTFQPPLFSVENWKEKQYSTLVWTCNFFLNFFAFGYSCFMIVLWLAILQFGNLWCDCT